MKLRQTLTALTIGALIAVPALADEVNAEAYIKYRENLMESAKAHSKSAAEILKGKIQADDHLARHARALHEVAMMLPDAFPEGSDFGVTNAKEVIWEDTEGFAEALQKFQDATTSLVAATSGASDPAMVGKAMKQVGESCKGCHKQFRSKD